MTPPVRAISAIVPPMKSTRRRFLEAAAAASVVSVLPSSPFEEELQAQSPGTPVAAPATDGYVLVTPVEKVHTGVSVATFSLFTWSSGL